MQFRLERDGSADEGGSGIELADVEAALDEMLFSGGSLNVRLLGGRIGQPVGADGNAE